MRCLRGYVTQVARLGANCDVWILENSPDRHPCCRSCRCFRGTNQAECFALISPRCARGLAVFMKSSCDSDTLACCDGRTVASRNYAFSARNFDSSAIALTSSARTHNLPRKFFPELLPKKPP